MTENINDIKKRPKNTPPPTQEQQRNLAFAQAINNLNNRMSMVEIMASKANANTDILNKRLDLFDKQIEFLEKRLRFNDGK